MGRGAETLGIYVSVPFCASKCTFCNFASDVFARERMVPYVARLTAEFDAARASARQIGVELPARVGSIYFGGGTPSLLPPDLFLRIEDGLRRNFDFSSQCEWTVECAPGQLSAETLQAMIGAGVNRISFGVQSFVDRETAAVGRLHTRAQTEEAIAMVRAAGIRNISVDLLAGLPHQTAASWRQSVDAVIEAGVPHVSVYMLEVDEDSRLGRELIVHGDKYSAAAVPDDDAIADFYETACEQFGTAGIAQYEISNFAREGHQSVHNLRYWRRRPYMGFGLDAHSCLDLADGAAVRVANASNLDGYLSGLMGDAEVFRPRQRLEEAWFLGLRQNDGVSVRELRTEFGELAAEFEFIATRLVADHFLMATGDRIALTPRGRMVSNDVFQQFVADRQSPARTSPPGVKPTVSRPELVTLNELTYPKAAEVLVMHEELV